MPLIPRPLGGFAEAMEDVGKSSMGFEEGIVAAASYFGFLGLVILMLERRSDFVRFHAIQSTLSFGLLTIFWLVVKWIEALNFLAWCPGLLALIFAIYMMIRAYHGEEYKLPLIGRFAFDAVYETGSESEDLLAEPSGDEKTEEPAEEA